jgi:hypothetical protein
MLGMSRAVAIAALLTLAVGAAQQPQTGAIAGTVADRSGGVLPGVVITVTGPSVAKGVTNARGEYRIDNLLPGEYRLEASLPGFRSGGATVTVSAGATTKSDVGLRLGLLSTIHYALPQDGISGAVREADVIAHIRLTGIARTRLLNDSMIVTDHDSTVLAVVKADAPSIVPGASLRFAQDNAGEWSEPGYRDRGLEMPYRPGDSFLAFLRRNKDSSLGESWGEWYMWPVKQGFVVIESVNPLPAGLRSAMPIDEALAALRKLLAAKNP